MLNPILICYVLATSGGLILLKMGSSNGALVELINGKISFNVTLLSVTGVVLYMVSFMLYLYLIAKNDLGYIVPITTALVYILVFLASSIIFKEQFTPLKTVGIVLIIIGAAILNVKR